MIFMKKETIKLEPYLEKKVCDCGGDIHFTGFQYKIDNTSITSKITHHKRKMYIYKCDKCGTQYESRFELPLMRIGFHGQDGHEYRFTSPYF